MDYILLLAVILLFLSFCWLAKKFHDVEPLTQELAASRAENQRLQKELALTRSELEKTRVSLDSCTTALNEQ
jgi:cell division protein FtsB